MPLINLEFPMSVEACHWAWFTKYYKFYLYHQGRPTGTVAMEGIQNYYWRTRIEIWLLRQKPLFFVMNAFIASVCEGNRTVAILTGSGNTPLQWYQKGFNLRKLSEEIHTSVILFPKVLAINLRTMSIEDASNSQPVRKRSTSSGRAFRGSPCSKTWPK